MSELKVGDWAVRTQGHELPEWPENEPRKVVRRNSSGFNVEGVSLGNGELYDHYYVYLVKVPAPEEQNTASEDDPISATTLLQDCMDVQLERGKQYDGGTNQERSFKRVAVAYNAITHRDLNGSDIALILQILKDVRIWTNMDSLHEDSVLDCVSYASLKGEELYAEFTEKDNQK